jgi:chromosome segregation ATPase
MGETGQDEELRGRLAASEARIAALEADLAALRGRADDANHHASDADTRAQTDRDRIGTLEGRADMATRQASDAEARATAAQDRIGTLEGRADLDAMLIAELQAEGLVNKEYTRNLELALRSSRTIGAAIGIVMAKQAVHEAEAFEILRQASMDTNRKVRDLADEVVLTGEVSRPVG